MEIEYNKDRDEVYEAGIRQEDTKTKSIPNKTKINTRMPCHFWKWFLMAAGVVILITVIVVTAALTVSNEDGAYLERYTSQCSFPKDMSFGRISYGYEAFKFALVLLGYPGGQLLGKTSHLGFSLVLFYFMPS